MREINYNDWFKALSIYFTDTYYAWDEFDLENKFDKIKIKKDGNISLYHLIEAFNKMYLAFKRDYAKLNTKLLGERIILGISKDYEDNKGNKGCIINLIIRYPNENISERREENLFLREENGNYSAYIASGLYFNPFLPDSYYKELDLDENLIKEYMDLFNKYRLLFDIYDHLKDCRVFGDGYHVLFTSIRSGLDNILDSLDSFDIYISSMGSPTIIQDYANSRIEAKFILGENLDINPEIPSFIRIENGPRQYVDKETMIHILKHIYINGKYLTRDKDHIECNNRVKSLKSLIKVKNEKIHENEE